MRLLMVSGDRQVAVGERGPFHAMQREFSRYFERVDVLCPRPPAEPTVHTIHSRVFLHPARCGRRGMVRYIAEAGGRLLREHGHTLIVSHDYGWFYNGLGSAHLSRQFGVPYLSEIHHVPGIPVASGPRERLDKWVARAYVRWARTRAAAFRVVNSTEMPAVLAGWGVPRDRILVLPSLYIDQQVFRPGTGHEPEPIEADVVFVGRMVANKGVDRILEALAILKRQGKPLTGLFVGKGPLRERLQRRAADSGVDARFVEWVDSPEDLARIYRRSRVCVCASTCEGGPRFTVEAMACGTPCVSTPVGVMSELLADGHAGRLSGFDPHALAAALASVTDDEDVRRQMGAEAHLRALPYEYHRALGVYANGLRVLAGHQELSL